MCMGVRLEKSVEGRKRKSLKQPIVYFGASVNHPPKSIDLNDGKTNRSLGQMEKSSAVVNAQLYVPNGYLRFNVTQKAYWKIAI
ncbi:hypothetical protein AVEN_153996-1 [Araneus ventricosus]|uniref:Uncharacterized protein n=1 Tax=Araneus ventricosus TaxID=182803 RepID=A0A4Y2UWN1_ARAVE|nr:hypothetical protein AVEN_119988-1 [Araneus ventricosus]GBO16686.1 hypothetical protein AVEN_270012-1 [Araneus ventricosus]GBO16687.1 hypothetical protein AVEN_153996-1 [Araneus ventricosus]